MSDNFQKQFEIKMIKSDVEMIKLELNDLKQLLHKQKQQIDNLFSIVNDILKYEDYEKSSEKNIQDSKP